MNECLTCKHWNKDKEDGIIGKCVQLNEFRFQFETGNMFCKYEFGENRKPGAVTVEITAMDGEAIEEIEKELGVE